MNSEDFMNLTKQMHKEEKEEYLKKNADYADREGRTSWPTLKGYRSI